MSDSEESVSDYSDDTEFHFLHLYYEAGYKKGFDRGIEDGIKHTVYKNTNLSSSRCFFDYPGMPKYYYDYDTFEDGYETGYYRGYHKVFHCHRTMLDELVMFHNWFWLKVHIIHKFKTNPLLDFKLFTMIHKLMVNST